MQPASTTDTLPSVNYTTGAVLRGSTGAILQRSAAQRILSLPGGVSATINGSAE